MVNRVMLVGRTGHDGKEKVKELGRSGSIVANLSVATSERRKNRDGEYAEHTVWHNCSIFGKQAEYVEKYVKKGDLVYIEGSIDQWKDDEGKYHTQIRVARIQGIPTGGGSDSRGRSDDRREDRGRDSERSRGRDRDDDRDSRRGPDRGSDRGNDRGGRGSSDRSRDDRDREPAGYSKGGPPDDDIPF